LAKSQINNCPLDEANNSNNYYKYERINRWGERKGGKNKIEKRVELKIQFLHDQNFTNDIIFSIDSNSISRTSKYIGVSFDNNSERNLKIIINSRTIDQ
jgi:hypothetical protein